MTGGTCKPQRKWARQWLKFVIIERQHVVAMLLWILEIPRQQTTTTLIVVMAGNLFLNYHRH